MRTIQPCFTKFSYCHIRPSYDTPSLPHQLVLWFSNLGVTISTLYIMPPFVPNQYMLDTHKDKGHCDWEIYAWCLRDAIAKQGGFGLSDLRTSDRLAYQDFMNKKTDSIIHQGTTYSA